MSVGAVGTGSGGGNYAYVYAALSPYLNGTQRSSQDAPADPGPVAVTVPPAASTSPRYFNPAITQIAIRSQVHAPGTVPATPAADTPAPASPTDLVLYGDSGLLIQSYGAVALVTGPVNPEALFGMRPTPAVAPIDAPAATAPAEQPA